MKIRLISFSLVLIFAISGCQLSSGFLQSDGSSIQQRLTLEEEAALKSLKLVDDYPLYTMHYDGPYPVNISHTFEPLNTTSTDLDQAEAYSSIPGWSCTLFAALGDHRNLLFGRNFDWEFSPALLLFTHPPDGYSSVSMVDISYLGFIGDVNLMDLPLEERRSLIQAVELPFDGMNDQGLAVGMAAVPSDGQVVDPGKPSIDSLIVMREILDHARTVEEALAIFDKYNIVWGNGPPLHYMIADGNGNSSLLEYYQGKVNIIKNENQWNLATNFFVTPVENEPSGYCDRYDRVKKAMEDSKGVLSNKEGLDLLQSVSQPNTQWSVLYGMTNGEIRISMGSDRVANPIIFQLK